MARKRICPRCGHQYRLEDLLSQVIYLTEKEQEKKQPTYSSRKIKLTCYDNALLELVGSCQNGLTTLPDSYASG